MSYRRTILAHGSDLLGYWPLDLNEPFARDISGNKAHGTLLGGMTLGGGRPLLASDRIENSSDQDGSNDRFSTSAVIAAAAQSSRTFEAWIVPDTVTGTRALWCGSSDGFKCQAEGASLALYPSGSSSAAAFVLAHGMSVGSLHHLVMAYDGPGRMGTLYRDGVLVGSDATTVDFANFSETLIFGTRSPGTAPRDGLVAHVAMYARVLTALEAAEHYAEGIKLLGRPRR